MVTVSADDKVNVLPKSSPRVLWTRWAVSVLAALLIAFPAYAAVGLMLIPPTSNDTVPSLGKELLAAGTGLVVFAGLLYLFRRFEVGSVKIVIGVATIFTALSIIGLIVSAVVV